MPTKRLSMRQIRNLLKLKYENKLSHRQIAKSCGIAVGRGQALESWAPGDSTSEHGLTGESFCTSTSHGSHLPYRVDSGRQDRHSQAFW